MWGDFMLTVSEDYKKEMRELFRQESHAKIIYDFVNVLAQDSAIFNRALSNNCAFLNNNPQLLTGDDRAMYTYITAELNRMPTSDNNNFRIIPYGDSPLYKEQDKVVSETLSGEDGMFTIPPTIVFDFDLPQEFFGFTILFDSFGGGYPDDFKLYFTNSNGLVEIIKVTNCTSSHYILENIDKTGIVSIKIIINSWINPHQRARMDAIKFGIQLEKGDNDLSRIRHTKTVDLLSMSHSSNEIEFSLLNLSGEFNALNPTGLWRYVQPNQKIIVEYGQDVNGVVEWFKGDTLFLDGSVSTGEIEVKFKARDRFNTLEHECYGASIKTYQDHGARGISLSTLAKIILDDYSNNIIQTPYKLDPCLDTIYTTARLDIMDIKEALQLIANAGHCILYTDVDGVITFKNALDPIITVDDNGGLEPLSNTKRAFNDIQLPAHSYIIADKDYITTDGTMIVASDSFDQLQPTGFISQNTSDTRGVFTTPPEYIINYSIPTSLYELPLIFDNVKNEYAINFSVIYQLNNQTVDTVHVTNNTQVKYTVFKYIERLDKIIIVVNTWSKPNQRCVINQIANGRVNDFYLDFNTAMEKPIVNSVDKIKQIDVSFYVLQPTSETVEVEGRCSRIEGTNAFYKFTHDPIHGSTIDAPPGISVNKIYTFNPTCTEFSITWNSTAEPPIIKLIGDKVEMLEHINSVVFNHFGTTKTFKNPLITSREQAELIARWLYDYVEKTSTFNVPYRGNPEIEPFDIIYLQSQFQDQVVSRVKSNKIEYDGTLSGNMEVIKL
jgi:hypothetical protein